MNKDVLRKYIFYPTLLGASGFSAIIILLTIVRLLDFLLGRAQSFHLQKIDFVYACLAFLVAGTIEYLKNFKHRQIL